MLDIIIILIYLFVILKYTLRGFKWFQTKIGIRQEQAQQSPSSKVDNLKNEQKVKTKKPSEGQQKIFTSTKKAQSDKQNQIIQQKQLQNDSSDKIQHQNKQGSLRIKKEDAIQFNRLETVSEKHSDDERPSNQNIQSQKYVKYQQKIQNLKEQFAQSMLKQEQENTTNQNLRNQIAAQNLEDLRHKYNQLVQQNQILKKEKLLFAQKLQKIINEAHEHQKTINQSDFNQTINELKESYEHKISQIQSSYDKLQGQMAGHLLKRNELEHIKDQISQRQRHDCSENKAAQNDQLKLKVEQLKGQLEFCQNQLHQSIQSQNKLKEENQELQKNTNRHGHASIRQVVNHPQYIRVKEMLNRYQTGAKTQFKPRSFIRGQFTPKAARQDKTDSRISERKQFIGSKYISGLSETQQVDIGAGLFPECDFLTQESKVFVLSQIKKIKKLNVKKTKQIYKLDKLHTTNPHDYIDNIPNIIIIIQLTNGKVIAAFTQVAFSKDDNNQSQKGSLKSGSRLTGMGSNKTVLIDVSQKKAFPNRISENAIIYDQNAIVWGRQELVIKNDQPTILYSQFGSQNGVYWDGVYTLQQMLGSTKKSERMNKYQIHRVYIS